MAIPFTYSLMDRIVSSAPQQTADFGAAFAQKLQPGDVVAFSGNLGSGKTTCIRGICAGLDVKELVLSPTFTLINEYHGRMAVYHFDFYRIHLVQELHDLGVEEYFYSDGICLVEWPEVVQQLLPSRHIRIRMSHAHENGMPMDEKRDTRIPAAAQQPKKPSRLKRQTGAQAQRDIRIIEVYQSDRSRH